MGSRPTEAETKLGRLTFSQQRPPPPGGASRPPQPAKVSWAGRISDAICICVPRQCEYTHNVLIATWCWRQAKGGSSANERARQKQADNAKLHAYAWALLLPDSVRNSKAVRLSLPHRLVLLGCTAGHRLVLLGRTAGSHMLLVFGAAPGLRDRILLQVCHLSQPTCPVTRPLPAAWRYHRQAA